MSFKLCGNNINEAVNGVSSQEINVLVSKKRICLTIIFHYIHHLKPIDGSLRHNLEDVDLRRHNFYLIK